MNTDNTGAASKDAFAATPAKMLPFARALAGDMEAHLQKGLGRPVTPAAVLGAAAVSHQFYEQTWRYVQNLHVVPHACASGCAYCCHLTVEASAPEVFLLAEHLRATCSPARLTELKERVRLTAAKVQGLSPEERVRAAVPCALLENGRCAAYAARPLGCRSWNSRDASACAPASCRKGEGTCVRCRTSVHSGSSLGCAKGPSLRCGRRVCRKKVAGAN